MNKQELPLRPLHDRVLIERTEGEEKTKGGIIIPDNAKEKPLEGVVMAVGSGRTLEDGTLRPLQVKTGDKILFAKYAETEVKVSGKTYILLREDDILGVWSK